MSHFREEIEALLPKLDVSGEFFKPRRGGRTLFDDDEENKAKEIMRMKKTLMQAYENANQIEGFHETLSRVKREGILCMHIYVYCKLHLFSYKKHIFVHVTSFAYKSPFCEISLNV